MAGGIVEQLTLGSQLDLAGVFSGSRDKFTGRADAAIVFDLETVASFDAVEQVFSHHPLYTLPVLRADGVAGFEVRFRGATQ